MNDPFSSLHYHFTVGYSSYFMLGHYLHEYELNSKQQKLIYVLGIFGLLFTIVSTYFMSQINQTAYKGFYNGTYTLQDLITAFNAELPIIPICFKNGMVIYSDRFGDGITPSTTELFHGIQSLK